MHLARDLGWRGHVFESHSQTFLLTYPGLIKIYAVLSSFFNCDTEVLTAQ